MRVLLTQPYVPEYRLPLFNRLRAYLEADGHELVIVAGGPGREQGRRADRATTPSVRPMRERKVSFANGRELRFRRLPAGIKASSFDVLITELDPSNTFALAFHLSHPKIPVILWGHGASFVSSETRRSRVARRLFVKAVASRVMTYSERGERMLLDSLGKSGISVTAIGNSTDTLTLRKALSSLTANEEAWARNMVGSGNRALFIGGLDASKRIHPLLESVRVVRETDPSFKLVVVGSGVLQPVIEAAHEAGEIVWIEAARGRHLAALASLCDSIWMPGRVGLVAVDALALGLPLVTVEHEHHAPEVDFLGPGEIYFVSSDPRNFASAARMVIRQPKNVRPEAELPSVESVASQMRNVILATQP